MKLVSLVGLVLSLAVALTALSVDASDRALFTIDADAGVNVTTMIRRRGYAVEEHKVVTADRYVLTMYRLPKTYDETQRHQPAAPNKPAVYIIHGLLDSSFTWTLNFRNQSLAYILADAGYDVWLGNNRGSTWSREHLDYTTKDAQFWDFSWDDMGRYDLPAMVNYVLETSGRPTVSYIGHSEGTTQAFVGFSYDQTLAKKISYFGALGPVAWVHESTSAPFQALAKMNVDKWFDAFGVAEFGSRGYVYSDIINTYGCAIDEATCDSVIQYVVGSSGNFNTSRIHVYVSQTPAGTSVKTMVHYGQIMRGNTFRRYDYGCSCSPQLPIEQCSSLICKNKAVYGTFEPPAYELHKIKDPRMAFFVGANDSLSTLADVAKLRAELPSGTVISQKIIRNFNHLDYSWAINAREKVFDELLTQMKSYEGRGY